jgi:hypothetical protein
MILSSACPPWQSDQSGPAGRRGGPASDTPRSVTRSRAVRSSRRRQALGRPSEQSVTTLASRLIGRGPRRRSPAPLPARPVPDRHPAGHAAPGAPRRRVAPSHARPSPMPWPRCGTFSGTSGLGRCRLAEGLEQSPASADRPLTQRLCLLLRLMNGQSRAYGSVTTVVSEPSRSVHAQTAARRRAGHRGKMATKTGRAGW